MVIRILKELIEYGNKIIKTQEEIKVTLSEIKVFGEPTAPKMKPEFKSMIWNIRKKHSTRTARSKKELKKTRIV